MKSWICLIMFIIVSVCANGARAGTNGGGIKGGILISSPVGEDRDNLNIESISTFTFGIFHRHSFENALSLQNELFYAHKGTTGNIYYYDGKLNIYYVEFDTVLQYRLMRQKNLVGYGYLGPALSYRMGANIKVDRFGEERTYDIANDINPIDIGIVAGVKVGFSSGTNEFCVDARYSMGFIAPDNSGGNIDLRNRTITILFEIFFG